MELFEFVVIFIALGPWVWFFFLCFWLCAMLLLLLLMNKTIAYTYKHCVWSDGEYVQMSNAQQMIFLSFLSCVLASKRLLLIIFIYEFCYVYGQLIENALHYVYLCLKYTRVCPSYHTQQVSVQSQFAKKKTNSRSEKKHINRRKTKRKNWFKTYFLCWTNENWMGDEKNNKSTLCTKQ